MATWSISVSVAIDTSYGVDLRWVPVGWGAHMTYPARTDRFARTAGAVALAALLGGCWLQPGFGPVRDGFNPTELSLTVATVSSLRQSWSVRLGARSRIRSCRRRCVRGRREHDHRRRRGHGSPPVVHDAVRGGLPRSDGRRPAVRHRRPRAGPGRPHDQPRGGKRRPHVQRDDGDRAGHPGAGRRRDRARHVRGVDDPPRAQTRSPVDLPRGHGRLRRSAGAASSVPSARPARQSPPTTC